MNIENAILAYLKSYAGLTALVSQKIFPDETPQDIDFPCVTYQTISDYKIHTLEGQNDLNRPMIQYTAWSLTKLEANAVAAQIELALNDYQGTMSGVVVQKIELKNRIPNKQTTSDGVMKVFSVDLEYEVNYES